MDRFCKNCKHMGSTATHWGPPAEEVCGHRCAVRDPVDGTLPLCRTMRVFEMHCGAAGKWFSPKDRPLEDLSKDELIALLRRTMALCEKQGEQLARMA